MKFEGAGWYWLGASEYPVSCSTKIGLSDIQIPLHEKIPDASVQWEIENESGDSNSIADSPRDCLSARLYGYDSAKQVPDFIAENCFDKKVKYKHFPHKRKLK